MARGGKRPGAGRKAKPKVKPSHRPLVYTQEMADRICERLAGGRSLRSICRDEDVIGLNSVFKWIRENEEFAKQYAHAREVQADVLFDEIHDIADTPVLGIKTVSKPGGIETTEGDMIEHRRLQIDSRKWLLGKMAPKKYGDKQTHEHGGPDGGPITLEAMIIASLEPRKT